MLLSGRNARRVVFGCMNLVTGPRLFLVRQRQRADAFQAFLREVRQPYRGRHVTLWGQGKDAISANKQYVTLDEQVKSFIAHLSGLPNKEALQTSDVLSEKFWLTRVLSKNFW